MQIHFNGKTYNSIEEMPANERQAYEGMFQIFKDENGNGIPDFLEGDMVTNVRTAFSSNVAYKGQTYNNLDELPPEVRQKLQAAFVKLNTLGLISGAPAAQDSPGFEPAFAPSKPLLQQDAAIEAGGGRNWMVIVGFLALMLFCAAAIAIFIRLR